MHTVSRRAMDRAVEVVSTRGVEKPRVTAAAEVAEVAGSIPSQRGTATVRVIPYNVVLDPRVVGPRNCSSGGDGPCGWRERRRGHAKGVSRATAAAPSAPSTAASPTD